MGVKGGTKSTAFLNKQIKKVSNKVSRKMKNVQNDAASLLNLGEFPVDKSESSNRSTEFWNILKNTVKDNTQGEVDLLMAWGSTRGYRYIDWSQLVMEED